MSIYKRFFALSIMVISLCSIATATEDVNNLQAELLANQDETVTLKFKEDGTFKIIQFTDTQDNQNTDPRTIELISTVCDDQQPDLVVFTGDNVRSGPLTELDVLTAIDNIVAPVDSREIPWFVTFGNHDEDHTALTGMAEPNQLAYYMTYAYNVNQAGPADISGTGNMHMFIMDSAGETPVFNLWGLDSNRYKPSSINGQSTDGYLSWDIIQFDQIEWYVSESKKIELAFGQKVPSFMFFHIPLYEFAAMWQDPVKHNVVGERNESECPGYFNSGLFATMIQRGDVRGVFVGHDHVNNYIGNYFGIYLGYAANAGFGTYGLDGDQKDRLRGARVFILNENDIDNFETYMVYAKDYGIQ